MKLSDGAEVEDLREKRLERRAELGNILNLKFGITLHGRYQDEDYLKAVQHAVLEEQRRRIEAIDNRLRILGVEVDIP